MNLSDEKISQTGYFRVGFDKHSNNYLLETDDTFGTKQYFVISEEQYQWFDTNPRKLNELYNECTRERNKSDIFYFSNSERDNSDEQNKRMWEYTYLNLLFGKTVDDVHNKMGMPDEIMDDGNTEIFMMSSNLELQVEYSDEVCVDVVAEWISQKTTWKRL